MRDDRKQMTENRNKKATKHKLFVISHLISDIYFKRLFGKEKSLG